MSLKARLQKRFDEIPKDVTPGFHLLINQKGKRVCDLRFRKTWPRYDLASLTKILFTTTFYMKAVSRKEIDLDKSVQYYLPWFPSSRPKVKNLLSHYAGLTWWLPLYKKIDRSLPVYQRWMQVQHILQDNGVAKKERAVYSDLDFLYLGFMLERVYQKPLIDLFYEYKQWCGALGQIDFMQHEKKPKIKKSDFAPTEKCLWRKQTLQGQVHDDNTWSLGGVAPQAGLFGRAQDIESWASWLRGVYRGEVSSDIKRSVIRKFFQRAVPHSKGDWALGFMMPSSKGSSAGSLLSKTSVGHTGFTGTSFWWDLEKDFSVILLSNRVYPSRDNRKFVKWRGPIHDMVYEEMFL